MTLPPGAGLPGMEVLTTGIAMGESPRWHDGRLHLSDWMAGELLAVDADGTREVVARVPSFPFCFDWHPDGTLLVVFGSEGRVMRVATDGTATPYADLTPHSRHPWNEIVTDARGNAWVNGIGFDFPEGEPGPGQLVLVSPDREVRPVAGDLAFPNGMAVTPDGSTLIVAESYAECLTAFDIAPDGGLSRRRLWAATPGDHPDGICLDAEGAVWYADVGSAHCVRVAEGGNVLDVVEADRGCFSCVLGGDEGDTLFVVANAWGGPEGMGGAERTGQVLTVRAPAPAAGR
jgi:sugar lactone lactonase YvrE